jgi:hypothetical protein
VRTSEMGVHTMKIAEGRWVGPSVAAVFAALLLSGLDASAQDAKKMPPAKAASSCKGLDEKACKGKTAECAWIAPKKGKQKAYCRLKPGKKA